jgi:hypothetical protein
MYVDDLADLDTKVADAKARGDRKASRSGLIRAALKAGPAMGDAT